MNAYQHAIDKCGSLTELARRMQASPQAVCNWGRRGIPTTRALDIEAATKGRVTAEMVLAEYRARNRAEAKR